MGFFIPFKNAAINSKDVREIFVEGKNIIVHRTDMGAQSVFEYKDCGEAQEDMNKIIGYIKNHQRPQG
jgi:hypothetical protein